MVLCSTMVAGLFAMIGGTRVLEYSSTMVLPVAVSHHQAQRLSPRAQVAASLHTVLRHCTRLLVLRACCAGVGAIASGACLADGHNPLFGAARGAPLTAARAPCTVRAPRLPAGRSRLEKASNCGLTRAGGAVLLSASARPARPRGLDGERGATTISR